MNLTSESRKEATPRPAATAVILRDAGTGVEVLLTIRPRSMRFMGGAAVFPGGALAPADLDAAWDDASRLSPDGAARRLDGEDPRAALGAMICALREAYEEVGFLVGSGPLDAIGRADADDASAFLAACRRAGVVLGTDRLVPAGRWVTPIGSPVRFDARFFLVEAPSGWKPAPDPGEVEDCFWIAPAAALERLGAGELAMAPPTIEMLQRLAEAGSAAEALASGAQVGSNESVIATPVGPGVTLVLAPNPGLMTGPGTNTYVIGRDPTVVVDPAMDDGRYLQAIMDSAGGRVAEIVVTHRHPDHVGGAVELASVTGAPVRAFGDAPAGGATVLPLEEGAAIRAGDHELDVVHAPGHASDHICLVLGDALFAGDNILGEGTAVIAPPDGDMRAYLTTLQRLRSLSPRRIFPGHFRVLDDGVAAIDRYMAHRKERHAAILAAISEPATVEDIVAGVYTDTPEALRKIAVYSVQAHLEMARADGDAATTNGRWFAAR